MVAREEAHLLVEDLSGLVLVGDRLDPVRVVGLLLPGPLRLADRVEVVAVPDVQAERQLRVAPLDDAVELAVEILRALEPHALPEQHLRVAQQHAQELDEGAVDERLAGLRPLEEVPDLA